MTDISMLIRWLVDEIRRHNGRSEHHTSELILTHVDKLCDYLRDVDTRLTVVRMTMERIREPK